MHDPSASTILQKNPRQSIESSFLWDLLLLLDFPLPWFVFIIFALKIFLSKHIQDKTLDQTLFVLRLIKT